MIPMLISVALAKASGWVAAQARPQGPPKSCRTRCARVIPSVSRQPPTWAAALTRSGSRGRVKAAAQVGGVALHGVVEADRLVGLPEPRVVPGDGAGEGSGALHQPGPVLAGARVAVDEHDGLVGMGRPG